MTFNESNIVRIPDINVDNWGVTHSLRGKIIPGLATLVKEVRFDGLKRPEEIEFEYYITAGNNAELKVWLSSLDYHVDDMRQVNVMCYSSNGKPVLRHDFILGDCTVTGAFNLNNDTIMKPSTIVLQFKIKHANLFNFIGES